MASTSSELPLCPICCDWLGKYGGPSTLPCGHNGCLDCFVHVQSCNAMCPLCRQGFDPGLKLALNHELRDLIDRATAALMDDKTRDEGWEAFPTAKVTNEHYAAHMQSEQRQQQQQLGQAAAPLSFQACYGPAQQQQQQLRQPAQPPLGQQPWLHYPAPPPGLASGSSGGGGGGGGGGGSGRALVAAAGQQQQQHVPGSSQGLGALLDGSGSGSGGGGGALAPQHHQRQQQLYHPAYHQHPGLPTSAPSGTQSNILEWEPPQWLPDSYAPSCCGCHQAFKPLRRLRHHCRLCGKVFCDACCQRRMLLPPRFRDRVPQRCCELCASLLAPLQPFLTAATSAAQQPPVHDALDAVSLRSWLNAPWGSCMADEIYKGANIVRAFGEALRPELERRLPASLLAGGWRGLALLSVMRLGAGWSCTAGTGLVVTRQRSGAWSAPCAISCCGLGWGLALGGQLTDVLLVLRTDEAVRAFAAGRTLGLGGAAGLALGPLGRSAEASVRLGGLAAGGSVLGYSCSRGAFAGVCLEGSVTGVRDAVNRAFYGQSVTPQQLLVDCSVPAPPAAALLYAKLDQLTALWESRGALVRAAPAAAAPSLAGACASAADCKAAAGSRRAAAAAAGCSSSSAASSYSREWDLVGSFAAAEALEQFDEDSEEEEEGGEEEEERGQERAAAAAGGAPRASSSFGGLGWLQRQRQQRTHVVLVSEGDVAGAAPAPAAAAGAAAAAEEAAAAGDDDDGSMDSADEFAASAPPAPTSVLYGLFSGGGRQQQQQQQQQEGPAAAAYRVQEPASEDEEPQYVLEW